MAADTGRASHACTDDGKAIEPGDDATAELYQLKLLSESLLRM